MAADERTVAFLRELERTDEVVAAVLDELSSLDRATEAVRERALVLETFLASLPGERERVRTEARAAENEAQAARESLAAAERVLAEAESARNDERRAAARRETVRARDLLRVAERRAEEGRAAADRLERDAAAAEGDAAELERRARDLAAELRDRPRLAETAGAEPALGLAGVSRWAAGAHAALFVALAGLASEREAVVRQANELGAQVLGEPLTSASAAQIARRVEEAGGTAPHCESGS